MDISGAGSRRGKYKPCSFEALLFLICFRSYTHSVGSCKLLSPLQVALNHRGISEEVKRNMVPLWFPGTLGELSDWILLPHVTLVAILGQA